MQAIISSGGKQFKVAKGSKINVEKLNLNVGDTVTFDKVLAIISEKSNVIGKPHVEGATVDAKIIEQFKGDKVTIIKFKRRKHYKKKEEDLKTTDSRVIRLLQGVVARSCRVMPGAG